MHVLIETHALEIGKFVSQMQKSTSRRVVRTYNEVFGARTSRSMSVKLQPLSPFRASYSLQCGMIELDASLITKFVRSFVVSPNGDHFERPIGDFVSTIGARWSLPEHSAPLLLHFAPPAPLLAPLMP